jgi:hypothetical protein
VSQAHSVKDIRPHLEALVGTQCLDRGRVVRDRAQVHQGESRRAPSSAGLMHGVGKLFILTRAAHYPFVLRDRTKYSSMLRKWHAQFAKAFLRVGSFPRT